VNSRLPPLGALLAFESAAQSTSFASAAKKLFVTPAAISQQIRLLEEQLQVVLFDRSKSGVKLTRAGESYLTFVSKAFEELRLGQRQLGQFSNQHVLTISALPSVAQKWLMPLVLQWMDLNPLLEIRVEASHNKVNFNHSACDMCISFGDAGFKDLYKEQLLLDSVTMVLSPKLVADESLAMDLDVMVKLPMIHVDWGDDNANLPQWSDWLTAVSMQHSKIQAGPRFNLSSMAIDAAVQGKGILLAQHLLIEQELKSGLLISPCEISLPLGEPYYLVYPQRSLDNPQACAFIEWIKKALL
jgi:LysR family glycine cleavage system transcriptional activator